MAANKRAINTISIGFLPGISGFELETFIFREMVEMARF